MSRNINIIFVVLAVSLIFNLGCKEVDQDAAPQEAPPQKVQPQEVITEVPDPAPKTPVAQPVVEEVKPVAEVPVVSPVIDVEEPVATGRAGWMTDYKAAIKRAIAEKKDMLLVFTGSKWCPACIALESEVFSHKKFLEAASKDFVLVFLDYPRQEQLAPKLHAQNEKLQEMYGMETLPTVFLTDAKGRPYAETTYQPGGPKAYLSHLSELRKTKIKFDKLMAKAQSPKADDADKAKLMDEAIRLMPPTSVIKFYLEEIEKIIALDSDNKAGLRDRHKVNLMMWSASQHMNAGDADKAIELIEKSVKEIDAKGKSAQEAYYFKALIHDAMGEKATAKTSLNTAIDAAPESEMATRIKEIIKDYFTEKKPE